MALVSTLALLLLSQGVVLAKEPCTEKLRTLVKSGVLTSDGSLQADDGTLFPDGTFWEDGEHWWACPCLSGHCVRICPAALVEKLQLVMAEEDVRIKIWEGQEPKWVFLNQEFKVIREAPCEHAFPLDEEDPWDESHLLPNGSLWYLHPNITADFNIEPMEPPYLFCIIPQEDKKQKVLICSGNFEIQPHEAERKLKYKIYPAFFLLSAIFLILTLVAFFLSPNLNTVHRKSVVCQSGSLLIVFLGLTINYLTGDTNHIYVCLITAYITHYFMMASFFWLNVMCIDLYLVFKGSALGKYLHKIIVFSLYAWGTPILISMLTVILEITASSEIWSPGVGVKSCWFQGFWSELIYFNGPVAILILSNFYIFGTIAIRLWQVKNNSKVVSEDEESSMYTLIGANQHIKIRLALYVKLFLLMGGTWIMEIVSWAVGGPPSIWFITDTVNSLRGVFIFWICVWSDVKVRQNILEKFKPNEKEVSNILPRETSLE